MVVQTLDAKRDPFCPKEDEEEILEPEVPYLSAIGTLLHWNGVKDIFHYHKGTTNLGLFYTRESPSVASPYDSRIDSRLVGYTDVGYLSDPHRTRSQTGYVFTIGDIAISWRSTKQMLVATSFNHAEILALHEASHKCFWLREVMEHI
ncbi:secreted RxLR effector protein 161-like [Malus domestica]|uniref:secreted RxLR effector protein 161-like n=1 Tax=Malus domestica TaxID=3750 RepID=UPI003976F537